MKKLISIFTALILFLSYCTPVLAYDMHSSDIEITAEQLDKGVKACIETALKTARDTAYDGNPVTVTLPSGKYKLDGCLHIYSNTNLVLQPDTVLIKTFEDGNMIKCGVQEEKNYGFDGYRNITVSGGIWDENFCGESCAMRFAHCSNITVKDLTVKDNKNSHHIEIAAAENFNILNCNFSGYKRTNSADGMAVQIDVIHNSTHFPSYAYYDDTPCKNVTVKGCTFENVYSGVGAYSGVIGSYFNNIVIRDNTFNNIKDKAIAAFNFINSAVYNNVINGASIGIIYEFFPFEKLSNRFYMPNSSEASAEIQMNANTKIKGNTVNITNPRKRSFSAGIAAFGGILYKNEAESRGLKSGYYLIVNLQISKNTVNVKSSGSTGMWLEHVYHSTASANTVRSLVKSDGGKNGITLVHSKFNLFKSNVINKFDNSTAFRTYSVDNELTKNTLKNAVKYGCAVDTTSSIKVNYGNTFKKNGLGAVLVRKKIYKPNKTIPGDFKTENKTLKWKRVKKVSGYKIFRSTKRTVGFTEIATVKGYKNTQYTDTSAENGTKYYYRISVFKGYKKSQINGKQSDYVKIKY